MKRQITILHLTALAVLALVVAACSGGSHNDNYDKRDLDAERHGEKPLSGPPAPPTNPILMSNG